MEGIINIVFVFIFFCLILDYRSCFDTITDELNDTLPEFYETDKNGFSETELKENIGCDTLGFNDTGFFVADIVEQEIPPVDIIIVLPIQQVYDG